MAKNIRFIHALTLLAGASFAEVAEAGTIDAASCALADVQSAMDSAVDGDTVSIPAGTCTWNDRASWKNKNIAVIGAGQDITTIDCAECFSITSDAPTSEFSKWRLSGMTLRGDSPGGIVITIWDNVDSWHYGWRIDHLTLDYPGAGSGYGIFVGGATYGVIDNNTIRFGNGLAIIAVAQMADEYPASLAKPQGGYVLSLPLDMGTERALYIEDNIFESTAPNGFAAYDTSSGGGRAVFRHNVVTGGFYYSHWTRGLEVGGVLHEIYNNRFVGNAAYDAYPIRIEAGTGVIFNNTVTNFAANQAVIDERRGFYEADGAFGACDGSRAWDGNAGDPAAPGWPCLGQIGRAPGKSIAQITAGDKQDSSPLTLWNNGVEEGCRTGGACTDSMEVSVWDGGTAARAYVRATPHPNGEVDYRLNGNVPLAGYSPFTYPHPLRGEPSEGGAGGAGGAGGTSGSVGGAGDGGSISGGAGGDGIDVDPGEATDDVSSGCQCVISRPRPHDESTLLAWIAIATAFARLRRRAKTR